MQQQNYHPIFRHKQQSALMISSPLATSSPIAAFIVSADRPSRRPPPQPKQTSISQVATSIIHEATPRRPARRPTSRTSTLRSADLSSIFTTPEEAAFDIRHAVLHIYIH